MTTHDLIQLHRDVAPDVADAARQPFAASPGKRSRVAHTYPARSAPVQRKPASTVPRPRSPAPELPGHLAAALGTGTSLPHNLTIQRAFGSHDVSDIRASAGGAAAVGACDSLNADAFATGRSIAFRSSSPSLHTAAHEAAHVIQQRAGVQLEGGVSPDDDPYERHADAVADAVVAGHNAEALLDEMAGAGGAPAIQRKPRGDRLRSVLEPGCTIEDDKGECIEDEVGDDPQPQGPLPAVGERPRLVKMEGAPGGYLKIGAGVISKVADQVVGARAGSAPNVAPIFQMLRTPLEEHSERAQEALRKHIYSGEVDIWDKGPSGIIDGLTSGTPAYADMTQRREAALLGAEEAITRLNQEETRATTILSFAHAAMLSHDSTTAYLRGLDPGTGEFQTLVDSTEVAGTPTKVSTSGGKTTVTPGTPATVEHRVNAEEMGAIQSDLEAKIGPQETEAGLDYPDISLPPDPTSGLTAEAGTKLKAVMTAQLGMNSVLGDARQQLIMGKAKAEKDELDKFNKAITSIRTAVTTASSMATKFSGLGGKISAIGALGQKNPTLVEQPGSGALMKDAKGAFRAPDGRFVKKGTRHADLTDITVGEKAHVRLLEHAQTSVDSNLAADTVITMIELFKGNLAELRSTVGAAQAAAKAVGLASALDPMKSRMQHFETAVKAFGDHMTRMKRELGEYRMTCLAKGREIDAFVHKAKAFKAKREAKAKGTAAAPAAPAVATEDAAWKMLALARVSEAERLLTSSIQQLADLEGKLKGLGLPVAAAQRGADALADEGIGDIRQRFLTMVVPLRESAKRFRGWAGEKKGK